MVFEQGDLAQGQRPDRGYFELDEGVDYSKIYVNVSIAPEVKARHADNPSLAAISDSLELVYHKPFDDQLG